MPHSCPSPPSVRVRFAFWEEGWGLCLLGFCPGRGQVMIFHWCLLPKYLALISKYSCINHVESKSGWKFRRRMINLHLNSTCPSASRRKALTSASEGRTWATGSELGCAEKGPGPSSEACELNPRALPASAHVRGEQWYLPLGWRQLASHGTYFWPLQPMENNFPTCGAMHTFQPERLSYMLLIFRVNLQINKYLIQSSKWDEYS